MPVLLYFYINAKIVIIISTNEMCPKLYKKKGESMSEYQFFIVDAFTDKIFGGNAAGVVILGENENFPSDEKMVKLAAELRYSETVFIKPRQGSKEYDFHARYFTPTDEVDLCGHATIGGIYCLNKAVDLNSSSIRLKTKAGIINVEINGNSVLMDMAPPKHIATFDEYGLLERVYGSMGISVPSEESISKLKPMSISTGLPDIMLPIPSKNDLDQMVPNMNMISELSKALEVVGIHAFATSYYNEDCYENETYYNNEPPYERKVFCRNFAPLYGIDEEAATGTSNGALAYYFYINGMLSPNGVLNVIQGESMQRPSSITATLSQASPDVSAHTARHVPMDAGNSVKIRVGGSAKILANGTVRL